MTKSKPNLSGPRRPAVDTLDGYRISNYQRYWQLYNGVQYPGLPNGRDKRMVVNYLAATAQKMAGYLMSPAPQFRFSDAGAAAQWASIAAANQLDSLDYEAALWAAVVGDAAFRLGWDVERGQVSVTACDVSQLWVRTRADDKRVLEWVAQRYYIQQDAAAPGNMPDPNPLQLGGQQFAASSASVEVIEEWTAGEYRLWLGGALQQQKANPFGFIPYLIVPNNRKPGQYWGTSDFADLWPVAAEINTATSTFATIIEYSGAPVVVVENVASTDNLKVGPGQLWDLPEQSKAYLLEMMSAGGAQLYVNYLERLITMFRDLSAMPPVTWGDVEHAGQPHSGAALTLQLNPLVQAVARRRLLWEDAFRARCLMAFAIAARMSGTPDFADVGVEVVWPNLYQMND